MKTRVALIYGGISGEHTVSCKTAASVMRAIDTEKFDVLPIAIATNGAWVLGQETPEAIETTEINGDAPRISPRFGPNPGFYLVDGAGKAENLGKVDVVFPLVHGPFGEDGTLQGVLEMMNIPYVGCGVFASSAGMDKHFMKVVLESAGLPVAPYVLADAKQWARNKNGVLERVEQELTYPLYVKPARAGSSLGITRVETAAELPAAVEKAHGVDPKVLIEQGVHGREVECAVLGGRGSDRPRTSVIGEIVLENEWYDFDTKYIHTDGFHMAIPAKLPEEAARRMREMAADLFEAFDCEGLTRADFFYTPEGDIYVNEHNTIPGFTNVSMYPILWEHTGMPYPELITELITLALDRPVGLR